MKVIKKSNIAKFIKATLFSVLIFFSVSFITFLLQIAPFNYVTPAEQYHLQIGFPFCYYEQFIMSGSNFPNFGWNSRNLLLDCFITWIVILIIYFKWRKL